VTPETVPAVEAGGRAVTAAGLAGGVAGPSAATVAGASAPSVAVEAMAALQAARAAGRRRLAVLGHPVAHSLSPVLHTAAYDALGLPWMYTRVDVASGELRRFLAGLGPTWLGLSLTMPLKREVPPLLARSTALVDELGVANTVRLDRTRVPFTVSGANTDVWGIVAALREAGVGRAGRADILGSGATAVSALRALADLEVGQVTVHARTPEHAAPLVALGAAHDIAVDVVTLPETEAPDVAGRSAAGRPATPHGGAVAAANDTAAGPRPVAARPIELRSNLVVSTLPPHAADGLDPVIPGSGVPGATDPDRGPVLLDVAYAPWPSRLAERWTAAGGAAVSGLAMLLWQAVAQVRFFVTGDDRLVLPDEDAMVVAMRAALADATAAPAGDTALRTAPHSGAGRGEGARGASARRHGRPGAAGTQS
jgi:shikimate dehydrogenase